MIDKKEKNIFKFLDITYGDTKLYENEESFSISGVCIYYKNIKKVGWSALAYLDLVRIFGKGRYYPQLNKWFSEKYNLEVK